MNRTRRERNYGNNNLKKYCFLHKIVCNMEICGKCKIQFCKNYYSEKCIEKNYHPCNLILIKNVL
jgi:hypothetical protein